MKLLYNNLLFLTYNQNIYKTNPFQLWQQFFLKILFSPSAVLHSTFNSILSSSDFEMLIFFLQVLTYCEKTIFFVLIEKSICFFFGITFSIS